MVEDRHRIWRTVVYTDQEVRVPLLIHNTTDKAIRIAALDQFNIIWHNGIRFDRVRHHPRNMAWQTLDAGTNRIYSVKQTWKKVGAYGAYFATDSAFYDHRILVDQLATLQAYRHYA